MLIICFYTRGGGESETTSVAGRACARKPVVMGSR